MTIRSWLAVNVFFVAINLVGAGAMLVTGWLVPLDARDSLWAWFIVGFVGLAAAILSAKWGLALISRPPSPARVRDPG